MTPAADPESSAVMESTDQSVPEIISTVHPSASVSCEDESIASPPPGYYLMSVDGPAADNVNTDAVANCSPCASLGVYSYWATSGLPAELL